MLECYKYDAFTDDGKQTWLGTVTAAELLTITISGVVLEVPGKNCACTSRAILDGELLGAAYTSFVCC